MNFVGLFLEEVGGKHYRRIATVYYPEEMPIVPVAYRGRPVLVRSKNGIEKCVACGLCEAACPPNCISIIGGERPNGDRYPDSYVLDGSRCIFCGFCEMACPEDAIELTEIYDFSNYTRDDLLIDKESLLEVYDLTKDQNYYTKKFQNQASSANTSIST